MIRPAFVPMRAPRPALARLVACCALEALKSLVSVILSQIQPMSVTIESEEITSSQKWNELK